MAPPSSYTTMNGASVVSDEMDGRLHLIFLGDLHESVAGTGSMCFAAASRIPGSVVNGLVEHPDRDHLRVGHASGVTPNRVRARSIDEPPYVVFDELSFSRTARRIMEGRAWVPAAFGEDALG